MSQSARTQQTDQPVTEETLQRGWALRSVDAESARSLALDARRRSRLEGNQRTEAEASLLLASVSYDSGAPVEALSLARESLALAAAVPDGRVEGHALALIGEILHDAEDAPGALEALLEAAEKFRAVGAVLAESEVLAELGMVAWDASEIDRAEAFFEAALAIAEPLQHWETIVLASSNLARLQWYLGRRPEATKIAKRAASIAETSGSDDLVELLADIALYEADRNTGKPSPYLTSARGLLAASGTDPRNDARWSYVELAASRAAMVVRDFETAAKLAETAVSFAAGGKRAHLADAHETAAGARKELGDFEAALGHLERAQKIRDELKGESAGLSVRTLLVIHDTDSANQRAAELAAEVRELSAQLGSADAEDGLPATFVRSLTRIAIATETRFAPSGRHPRAVAEVSAEIAYRLGRDPAWCEQIRSAARLHDIGKVALRADEALGPEGASAEALSRFAEHTVVGEQLLAGYRSPELRMAASIARSHHECWDGTGFPDGLEADDIPLEARIVAVADVYDSLISGRHEDPLGSREALDVVLAARGKRFDHKVVDAFHEVLLEHRPEIQV